MRLIHTLEELDELPPDRFLVPTMGALHGGHLSLVSKAKEISRGSPVLVSLFVNPAQFNDPADLDRYPRTLETDRELCEQAGADVLWVPPADLVYPAGEDIAQPDLPTAATEPGLEDRMRPGFFAGVCKVVARLFDLCEPEAAVFGEKDFQQLLTVRMMALHTHPETEIVAGPTIREEDGLAMASRNQLLSPDQRRQASAVPEALRQARKQHDAFKAEDRMREILEDAGLKVEYAAVRNATDLGPPGSVNRALVAARAGETRLIDNCAWPDTIADGVDG